MATYTAGALAPSSALYAPAPIVAYLGNAILATPPPNAVRPIIANMSPAAGSTILSTQPVAWDVTDDLGQLARAEILALFDDGTYDVAHDGGGSFAAAYAALSTRGAIAGGYHDVVMRAGGWKGTTLRFRLVVYDQAGNEATPIEYVFTVTQVPTSSPSPILIGSGGGGVGLGLD